MSDPWWHPANDTARARLTAVITRLTPAELARLVSPTWTVSATFAHLAWWDDYLVARWAMVRAGQDIAECPPFLEDVLNAAGTPQWLALPPPVAAAESLRAATAVDALIATLTPVETAWALAQNRQAMLDRATHRHWHLNDIERLPAG